MNPVNPLRTMENGHAAIVDGNVTGNDNGKSRETSGNDEHSQLLPVGRASPPITNHGKQNGHKRSLSGSILSRLSFMRTPSDAAASRPRSPSSPNPSASASSAALPSARTTLRHGVGEHSNENEQTEGSREALAASMLTSESAMALSQRIAKQRKRKGSLRKTALLGTGRLAGRERRNSVLRSKPADEQAPPSVPAATPLSHLQPSPTSQIPNPLRQHEQQRLRDVDAPNKGLTYPPMSFNTTASTPSPEEETTSADSSLPQRLSLDTTRGTKSLPGPQAPLASSLASPLISPTSQSYTSTTDDDDALTIPDAALKRPSMPGSGSYFPSQPQLQRRRSSKKPPSPLSAIPVNAYGSDEEYDYSETEWWGWVVLVVTWIVFVVGMGSCFGLWSWAWDVGETPYAPPELEDDPTLPIVGYYPALIILTGVMAWVWVVVAWVGMKYFKHAKMAGEDG